MDPRTGAPLIADLIDVGDLTALDLTLEHSNIVGAYQNHRFRFEPFGSGLAFGYVRDRKPQDCPGATRGTQRISVAGDLTPCTVSCPALAVTG